jgi:hypothetical protein
MPIMENSFHSVIALEEGVAIRWRGGAILLETSSSLEPIAQDRTELRAIDASMPGSTGEVPCCKGKGSPTARKVGFY